MFKRIIEDIKSAQKHDPAAMGAFTIFLSYPGVVALRKYRKANFFYRHGFKSLAIYLSYKARRKTGIEIHPAAKIGRRVFIDHGMGVVIGETSIIGDDVVIYQGVTLGTNTKDKIDRHPIIGNRVTLYTHATIVGRVTIGDDSIIGAHSLVHTDIPKNSYVKTTNKVSIEERYK